MPDAYAYPAPSTEMAMATITLSGTAYQRGVQYGRAFARQLPEFYRWFVQREPRDVLTAAYRTILEEMEAVTATHFPLLLDEIKGWSDGARLPYEYCRLLAFHNDVADVMAMHCSNVIVRNGPAGPWLARNCDLFADERGWQVARVARCDDCYSHVATGYLGLPVLMGVNSAGLAIGGSSLPVKVETRRAGLPNYASYLLATCPTVRAACETFAAVPFSGKGTHFALLDASGDAAAVQAGAGGWHLRQDDGSGCLVVTNHAPVAGLPMDDDPALAPYLENSTARYERLAERLANTPVAARTPELGERLLADHGRPISVCQHLPGGFNTIYAFVIQPRPQGRSTIRLCWGNPCRNAFAGVAPLFAE